jgi:hypothetical protein
MPACDLRGGLTDLAVDAHHQHGIARLRHTGAPETFHRGDEGHADPSGLFPRNIAGLLHHGFGFHGEMSSVGAVAADSEIA